MHTRTHTHTHTHTNESWTIRSLCVRERMLSNCGAEEDSSLDCKEIKPVNPQGNPEYSLEGLMLKLKLQYFGHLM